MSLFKSRSGGSMFRFRALSGYLKVLFQRNSAQEPEPTGEFKNKMSANYGIQERQDV